MHRITLIHGTFAAKSAWVLDDENSFPTGFRARLKSALGGNTTFNIPKPWGATSLLGMFYDLTNSARLNGAENLKQELLRQPKVDGEKHFLVAHSHGGNVAMYALQDQQVQQRVDGLICMATPFLFPRRRPLSITALILSLIIMTVGVAQIILPMNESNQGALGWLMTLGLVVAGVVLPTILVWMVFRVRHKQTSMERSKLTEHIASLSYSNPNIPILLIRSSGDEASGLLRGTQFLSWLGGIVMHIGGRQLYILGCISALLLFGMVYFGPQWIPARVLSALNFGLIWSAAVMMIMLAALTLSRVVIGLDAWRWVGELETMIEDGPPGIHADLLVITPRQPKSGLSHTAVYTEPETTEVIAKWCAEH